MYTKGKYLKPVLFIISCFTLINIWWMSGLKFDFEIDQLFPLNDPDLDFYQTEVVPFYSADGYMVIGIVNQAGIFNSKFITDLDRLTRRLDSLAFVFEASSLTTLTWFRMDPLYRISERPFISVFDETKIKKDSALIRSYVDVWEKFVSAEGDATAVFLKMEAANNDREASSQLTAIKQTLDDFDFDKYHLSGSVEIRNTIITQLKSELWLLMGVSLTLITLILFLTFRSKRAIGIPMLIILLSVCWTMGTLALFDVSLNTMTVIVPSIILIVALGDAIHIMARFKKHLYAGESKKEALAKTYRDTGTAIFLTSITTAIGFLTLSYADIQPFVDFGIFTALGVMYAWLLAITLLPILLLYLPFPKSSVQQNSNPWYLPLMARTLRMINKYRYAIIALSVLGLGISLWGASLLRVDSRLYEEISSSDEYSESLDFFDQQFSGIRPVEIFIRRKDSMGDLLEYAVQQKLDQLERYLKMEYGVQTVYSVLTQIKRMNRVVHRGRASQFHLPEDTALFEQMVFALDTGYQSFGLSQILSRDYQTTLVSAKMSDIGSYEISEKNRLLDEFLDELFPPTRFETRITGKSLLWDHSNAQISRNLTWGLLTAILIISGIMGLLFRSGRMVVIALIPNLLPLLIIAGIMGFAGIGLKMSTAIIFTIAFGIAVDDTIHFLSRLRVEWTASGSMSRAIDATWFSTGKAIVLTSLILIMGFGGLMLSSLTTTFLAGLFLSLALLIAVLADLVLLPVLLWLFMSENH